MENQARRQRQLRPCPDQALRAGLLWHKEIDSPNIGRKIVWDMVAYADGLYDDGKIYSPDRDKTYNADMTLSGNSLSVRGCVLGICRDGGTWKRVK